MKMKRNVLRTFSLFTIGCLAVGGVFIYFSRNTVHAQSSSPDFDGVAYALRGSTTLTVLGVPATLSIDPVGKSEENGTDGTNDQTIGAFNIGLPGLPIVSFDSADDSTQQTGAGANDDAKGTTTLTNVNVLGGLIKIGNVSAGVDCHVVNGTAACDGSGTISQVTVAGQSITVNTTQPNQTVSILGNVTVNVAGLPVQVPVSGTVTFFEVQQPVTATGSGLGLIVNAAHIRLTGGNSTVSLQSDIIIGGPYEKEEVYSSLIVADAAGWDEGLQKLVVDQCIASLANACPF